MTALSATAKSLLALAEQCLRDPQRSFVAWAEYQRTATPDAIAALARGYLEAERDAERWRYVAASPNYQGTWNGYRTFTKAIDAAIAERAAIAMRGKG